MTKLFDHPGQEPVISLEMIEFQSDFYPKDIESLFKGLMEVLETNPGSYRTINTHPFVKKIEEFTFKRTGIKIGLVLNGAIATVLPFCPNEYSVLLDKTIRGKLQSETTMHKFMYAEQYKIMETALQIKGTVDTENCRVSGVFSEYKNPIHINVRALVNRAFTAAEITAVFLHELGHCWGSYEYSNRMNRTNQILAEVLREVTGKKTLPKEYVFKELKVINPRTTNEELDKIFSGDNIVISKAMFRFLKETIESQMTGDHHNDNVFETLADNFAARWGYSTHLVTANEKLEDKSIFNPRQNLTGSVLGSISSVILILVSCYLFVKLIIGSATMLVGATVLNSTILAFWGTMGVMTVYLLGIIIASFILWHSTYDQKMTYDDLKFRYKRIRNQLVEQLKDSDIQKAQARDLIDQIKLLDDIIEKTNGYKNAVTYFLDFFTPGHAASQDDTKMQRLLEELSANDLYVKAASLRIA